MYSKISEDRVDVMVDLEALSMKEGGTLLQICAKKFDIETGRVKDTFNMYVDISQEELVTDGDTLKWWIEDSKRSNVLKEILRKGKNSEEYVVKEFNNWLGKGVKPEDVYLWGNGILDDNRVLCEKFIKYGLDSPVSYKNHRDVRTFVEVACLKSGVSYYDFVGRCMDNKKAIHNALNDVEFQINLLVSAFKEIDGKKERYHVII